MAKRAFATGAQTFSAQAVSVALVANSYMSTKGGSSTQLIDILEVLVSGMATASTVAAISLDRVQTISTGASALVSPSHDGPMHPSTATLAAPPVTLTNASTGPYASATVADALLNFGLNLFGGILRWNAAPTQQYSILGNTAPLGEALLWNSSTGGGSNGLANAHIIYEPY